MDALRFITALSLLTQVNCVLISQASGQQLEIGGQVNITQLLFIRFRHLFPAQDNQTGSGTTTGEVLQQSSLETRKIDQLDQLLRPNNNNHLQPLKSEARKYLKIVNRVFSRVELPKVYKAANRMRAGSSHCGLHIGCVEEIPNFASLLRKTNVSSSYTLYSRENPKVGHKILYEPIVHHQLEDPAALSEPDLHDKLSRSSLSLSLSSKARQVSWLSALNIVHSQEYPFDLAALELSGFNSSLNTRVIVGGYFAKEDEEWIDEVVRQWLLLEPCNIIKVSWADANRGLYHSAAYNSRIVGRQLTLFLYYLDQLFRLDLSRFHLVGHSLGAHIAGFVGADNEGRIARITGLDPAGPIFVELNASMRLDPTDARFVDVLHTNGGSITKGALGLSSPAGHVDYYCNGGSLQPGCYFSSVTKSIMDPVERVACSHRRSYRYFIEIIKLTIAESAGLADRATPPPAGLQARSAAAADQEPARLIASRLPRAFLFEAKQEELVRLTQPEIVLMSGSLRRDGAATEPATPPLKRPLEFHLLNPEFPPNKRGMYFFKTRSESPFFGEYT